MQSRRRACFRVTVRGGQSGEIRGTLGEGGVTYWFYLSEESLSCLHWCQNDLFGVWFEWQWLEIRQCSKVWPTNVSSSSLISDLSLLPARRQEGKVMRFAFGHLAHLIGPVSPAAESCSPFLPSLLSAGLVLQNVLDWEGGRWCGRDHNLSLNPTRAAAYQGAYLYRLILFWCFS